MTIATHRLLLAVTLAAVAGAATAAPAAEPCPPGPLQAQPAAEPNRWTTPQALAELAADTRNTGEPAEIARLREGVVTEYVGGFINDGKSYWTGYDAQRQLFVSVGRSVLAAGAPRPAVAAGELTRVVASGDKDYLEIVRIVAAGTDAVEAVTCAANRAWRAKVPRMRMLPPMTDTLRAVIYVINDGMTRSFQYGDLPREDEQLLLAPIANGLRTAR